MGKIRIDGFDRLQRVMAFRAMILTSKSPNNESDMTLGGRLAARMMTRMGLLTRKVQGNAVRYEVKTPWVK